MEKKTIPRPDVANGNPDAGTSVDEEFVELMDDEDPDELAEIISLESIEQRWPEEAKNSLEHAKEYDPDLDLKALKEREWEKKMGVDK